MSGLLGAVLLAGFRAAVAGVAALWLAERRAISPGVRHGLVVVGLAAHLALFALGPLAPAVRLELLPRWAEAPAPSPAPIGGPTLAAVIAEASAEASGVPVAAWSRSESGTPATGLASLALLGWAVVAGAILLVRARDVLAAARLVRRGSPCFASPLEEVVDRTARALGLRRVRVTLVGDARVPAVWGLLRPTLLLPREAIHWPTARLEAVARHELAHLRRGDLLAQHLARLVTALFWWSPVAWLLDRRREELAETSCDARVIAGGTAPADYAALLITTVRELRGQPLAGSIGLARLGRRADRRFERRVRAILVPVAHGARWRPVVATGLVAGLIVATAAFEPVARRSTLTPPLDGRGLGSATGCRYEGGRHLNRLTDVRGPFEWQVSWDGAPGCRVDFVADQAATIAIERGELETLPDGARFTVRLTTPEGSRLVDVRGTPSGVRVDWDDGAGFPSDWVARFVAELDRHTGFAAYRAVPVLLAGGGVDAVLARVAAATGDHAGLRYLSTLVDATPLDPEQLLAVLDRAQVTGDNEAELVALLERIGRRYPLDSAILRDAYGRVAARLRTEAGRAAIATLVSD